MVPPRKEKEAMKVETEISIKVRMSREEIEELIQERLREKVSTYVPGEFKISWGYYGSNEITAQFRPKEEVEPEPQPAEIEAPPALAVLAPGTSEFVEF